MAKKSYLQLTYQDRVLISHWKSRGFSISDIARRVGVHKSTISRELRRNSRRITREDQLFYLEMSLLGFPKYQLRKYAKQIREHAQSFKDYLDWNATVGQRAHEYRRLCSNQLRRRKSVLTRTWVIEKLKAHWSPEQIAGRSKIDGPETVSHEYVYRLLYEHRQRGGNLHRLLKRYRKRKQRFGARQYAAGPRIPNRISIEKRPKIAEQRKRLGDLEGDLIHGYCASGYILSVVDRKSRYVVLRKLKNKGKTTTRIQLERAIRKMKWAKTLTLDNGSEFTDHQKLTELTGVNVYFAHPYSSSERGTNENSNALVRHFLPKKTSFARLTQTKLNEIQRLLNNRPREILNYLTPIEVHFSKHPKSSHKTRPLQFKVEPTQGFLL